MRWVFALALAFIFASVSAFAEQPTKVGVRNSSGKLLYRTITRGSLTEVRNASGKLLMKSKTRNGTTEFRSPTGKLLYKSK